MSTVDKVVRWSRFQMTLIRDHLCPKLEKGKNKVRFPFSFTLADKNVFYRKGVLIVEAKCDHCNTIFRYSITRIKKGGI